YSLSVIRSSKYLTLDAARRRDVAAQFYNDMYWFDQMACSSPRLLVWCGGKDQSTEASAAFFPDLHSEIVRRGYTVDAGGSMNKLTFLSRAILDQPVSSALRLDSLLTVAELDSIKRLDRDHCGGGFLFQYHAANLEELAGAVTRKDQTLTQFGFDQSE